MDQLPPHVRPTAFSLTEVLLDLVYATQAYYRVDCESVLIMLCLSEATMREFVLEKDLPPEIMNAPKPPEHIRGALSRRMIADKTGLPRETVRRRVAELIERGYVVAVSDGTVRAAANLDDPRLQDTIAEGHRAVMRYLRRLDEFGVAWREPL
ncbi:MAG: helix-turn-helix domain-containing protein [Hyphomonadaceae bacterium]